MVLHYLLWHYRSRGNATAAGAEALRAVSAKSAEKNIVRISTEPMKEHFFFSSSFWKFLFNTMSLAHLPQRREYHCYSVASSLLYSIIK